MHLGALFLETKVLRLKDEDHQLDLDGQLATLSHRERATARSESGRAQPSSNGPEKKQQR